MEFMILDANFDAILVVDAFHSAIWTVRFNSEGDFELYMPVRSDYVEAMVIGNYVWRKDSDRLMVIDTVEISSDTEDVPKLTVTGTSLEGLLKRRIIVDSVVYEDKAVNEVIKDILDKNIISPAKESRKIPNFTYKETTDERITGVKISTSFRGENVYEAVEALCQATDIGFRVLPSGAGGFEFELYKGVDHSYDQNEVPYVVFSPSFENLYELSYLKSYADYKNTVYSIGTYQKEVEVTETDDEGNESTYTTYEETEVTTWADSESSEATGLNRREIFLDNNSLNEDEQGGEESKWVEVAAQKGSEELAQYKTTTAFEGELDAVRQFVLGKDFDIGDIVQVENEFGITGKVYISEIVISHDDTGLTITPTFTATEETETTE